MHTPVRRRRAPNHAHTQDACNADRRNAHSQDARNASHGSARLQDARSADRDSAHSQDARNASRGGARLQDAQCRSGQCSFAARVRCKVVIVLVRTVSLRVVSVVSGIAGHNGGVLTLPEPCLVVLVGPGAAGKSTWAAAHFRGDRIVSSDALRALAGAGEDDLAASADAFEILEMVVERRVRRRLTTVIDTLGLDTERRRRWIALAREHNLPCVAVGFDTPAAECRARNRARTHKRIPAEALTRQLREWTRTRDLLQTEGFSLVLHETAVRTAPAAFAESANAVQRQADEPTTRLRFGLHIGEFKGVDVRATAQAAEAAGFDAIYVMDHFRQIPQLGRAWDDFLESWTTLAYLAACTERVRLGTLVSGVTYRNVAHLGKIVATLDVLSGGRAVCGLGLAWFKDEHKAYGWDFPNVRERYALLEDALQLLPLLWGKGSPSFQGQVLTVPEAMCYPRPVQPRIPIIVGGNGERHTLRLAAQYADAANVMGDLETVRRKASVLREYNSQTALTHLTTALVSSDDRTLDALVEAGRGRRPRDTYAAAVHAGTVGDHIGRFRALADSGVQEVMVRLAHPDCMEPMSQVIAAFRD
ncbi:LLM class flavin-dependent oxidoreductase [Dactylosporangium sp. NPDC051541]|uniref:LLM class flavin-dependent oxidoreductase n=1 Tax=Dactylosporangium sp. NPDC051541 TaxID=3363977 RepID=UPI0037B651EB